MKPNDCYRALQHSLATGWNTWSTRSVLSHVLLPEGIALHLGLKEYHTGQFLREALVGRFGEGAESVHPGLHAADGSYTELVLRWQDIELSIRSAALPGDGWVLLAEPRAMQERPATLVVAAGLLWNRPGTMERRDGRLLFRTPTRTVEIVASGTPVDDLLIDASTPYLALSLDGPVALSAGCARSPGEALRLLDDARARLIAEEETKYGAHAEAFRAMRTCLAWDTIYEPSRDRVVSTVSRLWNIRYGGYVLFCWDTYFAAAMAAAAGDKALAYANAVEITRARLPEGFVPNYAAGRGASSRDRSQPPVGATVVLDLFRRYGEAWLPALVFDDLLGWNDWFHDHRRNPDGTLSWGSDAVRPTAQQPWSSGCPGTRLGAALESGLDNSPMYDDIPYDEKTHRLCLADVGLTSLHLLDCESLAELADALGREDDAARLRIRAAETETALETLWNEDAGIYCNRRTDTGEFSLRLSPTNFYALFSRRVPAARVGRMMREHLLNPAEFGGEWMLPSIARNDPAYPDQRYWRGRIWAPLNYLVSLALRRHPEAGEALRLLGESSEKLLLKEWLEHGHVHENYSADTGDGCGVPDSDRFYHWGGLLALVECRFP